LQGVQMLLVLFLAPLLDRLRAQGEGAIAAPPRPAADPALSRSRPRLMRKDVVLADSASWLFRVIPYLVFAAIWVAASLVPTFRTGLLFSWSADLIAIIALLGSRALLSGAGGLDVGTSFGGIGPRAAR
jgi:formate hydrogenlyase subunit 4